MLITSFRACMLSRFALGTQVPAFCDIMMSPNALQLLNYDSLPLNGSTCLV